jgi:hypothetical protein
MSLRSSDPLTIGNVVSAGFRLYRDRLGSYFGIAFISVLWAFVPLLVFVGAFGTIATAMEGNTSTIVLGVLVGIIIWVYGIAKSLANTALISRLAFRHLSDRPEAVSEARRFVMPRMWSFLWMQILVGLLLFVINIGLSIAQSLVNLAVSTVVQEFISLIINFIINIVFFVIYLWLYSHFFIPEVILAIEENTSSTGAISRSWNLASGSVWRIQGIVIITTLITLPLYIIAALPILFALISAVGGMAGMETVDSTSILQTVFTAGASVIVSIVLFGLINIFVIPLWQSIKAVIYYDLRSRREGIDLEIKDSQS